MTVLVTRIVLEVSIIITKIQKRQTLYAGHR